MPFVTPEDVGTTPRGSLSAKRRLQAWERTGGTCVVCARRIDGLRERWIVEHIRALELGGADELDNMGPAHEACGGAKTRDDHTRTARAKRQKLRHLGALDTSRPFPSSRAGAFKRKVNGQVVRRVELTPVRTNNEVRAQHARDLCSASKPLSGDDLRGAEKQLCKACRSRLRENKSRTMDPMANRSTTATPKNAEIKDTGTSGEILPAIPQHLAFLFDDRPLLFGDDPEQYEALLGKMVQQVMPTDIVEAIWVKDIIDLVWEVKRLRHWRNQILSQARVEVITALIVPVLEIEYCPFATLRSDNEREARGLAFGWLEGNQSKTTKMEEKLQKRGLTVADVMAQAFQLKLPEIERIERMVASADQRRDTLLRDIERKRASLSQRLRAAAADVIDVEPSSQDTSPFSQPRR
ncbi:HNH endonuclease signature motif containing protein [uncultured Methylobacterium sp.]|uniref:HNH endonuclease signature motif containing protein n=1 Tax=uncultured Methylobacterium sp. TaxID=157278 RepID=UPI0035CB8F9C